MAMADDDEALAFGKAVIRDMMRRNATQYADGAMTSPRVRAWSAAFPSMPAVKRNTDRPPSAGGPRRSATPQLERE
jgi:hypothetical protein